MNPQVVPEFFNVICNDNPISSIQLSESIMIDIDELGAYWPTDINERSEKVMNANGKINNSLAVSKPTSDTVSPVTHIEIIKSSSRRVTGANRVVPLLTSALNSGKLAITNFGLADVYKSFLCDVGNIDSNRKCLICLKELLTCTELEHHVKEIHNSSNSPDQCFVCRKKYVFQEQLRDHLHHIHSIDNPDLICKICFMEFSTSIEQKAHERKHEQTYACHMCRKKFSSEYLCQKHLNQHLIFQGNIKDCKKCGRTFKNIASLEIHEKRHTCVQCAVCEISFNNDIDMLFHIKNHKTDDVIKILSQVEQVDQDEKHLEGMLASYSKISNAKVSPAVEQSDKSSDEAGIFDCLTDLISAVTQNNNAGSEKKQGIECKLCGKSVTTNKELMEHRRHFHLRNRTCPFCGKRNRSVSQTWRHMKSHIQKNKPNSSKLPIESEVDNVEDINKSKSPRTYTRMFSCHICSRKFLYPGSRDNHVLQHSKDKDNWKCAACGDVFSDPGLLLSHSSIHKSSIQCNICAKEFSSQSTLQNHLKSHSSEEKKKKHKCTFCSVECPTLFGLQAHIRCHTGERPYTCGQCQRTFKRLQAVKKHIQVVHNSASLQHHSCSGCSKVFNSSGNMIRHYLRIHCQVRRFICGICGSRFGQNQDMRRHFKVFHKLDMPNINGTDRKALKEIYVIPSIDNLPESHPHAIKIKSIVAEEKAKYKGLSELMSKKSVHDEDGVMKSIVKFLQEFSSESDDTTESPCITSLKRTDEETNNITLSKADNNISQSKSDLPLESNINEIQTSHPTNNPDSKWIICKVCDKQYLGEVEYLKHVAVGNDSLSCKQCGLSFCDNVLLDYHLSSEHEIILAKINVNEIPEKENYSLEYQTVKDTQTFSSVIDMQSTFDQEIFSGDQNHSLIMSNGENLLTLVPDTMRVNSVQTDGSNSGALNINGIVVQNIFIQQAPGILQTVPVSFQNPGIINSSNLTPVVTFNSLPVTSDEQTNSSLFALNNNHDLTLLNGNNMPTNLPKNMDNTINKISSIHEVSQINEKVTNVNDKTLDSSTSMGFLENTEENRPKEIIQQSTRKRPSKKKHEGSKKPTCEYCNEQFYYCSSLNRHMKCHTEAKNFECPHCGKHFAEKYNLKVHIMIHTGERPFMCEECGKQLRYREDVLDHKRMHMGEKPFACDECGRKFLRRRELIRHKAIHTGEKKHKCPICGKAFARLDQLKLGHLPTHEKVNSHTCNICNKTFKLKSKLKQHQILHSGVKEFQCDICQKRFALSTYLRTHMQSHKRKDTFLQCNICHRQFANDKTLQVHKQTCSLKPKKSHIKKETELKKSSLNGHNVMLHKENEDLEREVGADNEMQDVDLSMLDADSCNAVIYLHMTPEDLKLTFSGSDDKLFTP